MDELSDAVRSNSLKSYPTKAVALAAVRTFLAAYGQPTAEARGVIREDRRGGRPSW